jgi:fructosamine-3-kinase
MFIEHQRIRCTPVGSGATGVSQRLTLDDGSDVFAKFLEDGPEGLMAAEQRGLRWMAQAGAPVPELLCGTDEVLVTEWITPGAPSPAGAEALGRGLARLHRAGAETFGAPWRGYIGSAPMDNTALETSWPQWFASRRLRPYLRASVDNGSLDGSDARRVEAVMSRLPALSGPAEPIARLHGDLWPGNLLWDAAGRGWLIDPAAHGGHRETDLACLHLWGGPAHLDRIVAGYQDVWPLAEGWRERLGLHQLFLLLVHTTLFGRSYRDQVLASASVFE